jgi:hypothetical protein
MASVSFAAALVCASAFAVSGATNEVGTPAAVDQQSNAASQVQQAPGEKGCSSASLAVMNDIAGSVFEDPFHSNPSFGGGSRTDPPGCGSPTRTRKVDPGNPVTPPGRPTSSFTIRGSFP